jgi:hypothetical protein
MGTPRKAPPGAPQTSRLLGTGGYGGDRSPMGSSSSVLFAPDPEQEFYYGEEWQLACRVAASKGLSKSELLPRFLLHVCELSLRGRTEEITEQRIGTLIFNRPPDYNPGEDNIVRSYARTMRKRLDDYFDHEGRHERLRIHIPRGGYVPVFEAAVDVRTEQALSLDPSLGADPIYDSGLNPGSAESGRALVVAGAVPFWRAPWFTALVGIVAGIVLATAGWLRWSAQKDSHQRSAAHAIWSQVFQNNRNTLIVPADSGLGILENLSKQSVTVEQYANGSYLDAVRLPTGIDKGNVTDLGQQRYTSFVDLDIAARLEQLPEYIVSRSQFRFSRGVTAEDIKESNVILLGSKHTDPWVALFENKMNFTFEYTSTVNESYIVNHAPTGSEPKIYRNGADNSRSPTYGVIAYLPGLDGTGHALIIEGLNMAGTQAAAEVLFNENLIGPVLQKAKSSDGTPRAFELLVETSSVGAASPGARIVDTRIHE